MTGFTANDAKSLRYDASACSDNKVSGIEWTLPEKKESFEHDSDKSDATYTKSDIKFPASKSALNRYFRSSENKSNCSKPKPFIARQRLYSSNGIIEPTFEASKKAQWLTWNDPAFKRRRSFDEPKFRARSRADIHDHKSTVAAFKRSLQLLGIKYEDLGLEDDIHKNKNIDRIGRGHATPTFSTQLKHRSVSLTNLRNAVQESGLPAFEAVEKLHRDILSRAVYEEWYFRKLTENKIKKELEEEIRKQREEELRRIKDERQRRAEENFKKWKNSKVQLKKEQVKEGNVKANKPSSQYARNSPNSDGAFESWKAKKDEEKKKQKNLQKQLEEQERKKKEERERKEAAESAFKAWKKQMDEQLRNKSKEREREKELIKEKELKKKQEDAKNCYNQWKNKKDNEIKQKLKRARIQAKKLAEEKGMKKAERQYDAAQAFEKWLDEVDERMEKENRKHSTQTTELPPWCPR